MTKVMIEVDKRDGTVFFDCMNHAGFTDVCIMCSTLCNVLIVACERANVKKIVTADAHVQLSIDNASESLIELFESVKEVFQEIAYQFPEHVKIY